MQFLKNRPCRTAEVRAFSGVDVTSGEHDGFAACAQDAANVYIDEKGRIRKRTGYKKLFSSDAHVNGFFCYDYRRNNTDKKQYFIHLGTSLYFCDFAEDDTLTLGACITDGLSDKKSRGFVFGDALYLLGAGYFKIVWDTNYHMFMCGRVHETEMVTDRESVILTDRVRDDRNYTSGQGAFIDATCREKRIKFEHATYDFTGTEKLYVAPAAAKNLVRVERVEYESDGIVSTLSAKFYQVSSDTYGLYVMFKRPNTNYEAKRTIAPQVVITYAGFCHVPTNIIMRTPTKLESFGEDKVSGETYFDGTFLESYNLAAPHRAVEFLVPAGSRVVGGLRFYLETKADSGAVLRVYVDGTLVQSYVKTSGDSLIPTLGSYKNQYMELDVSILPKTECTVRVEYTKPLVKTRDSYIDAIDGCSVFGIFGGKNDTRVFLSGYSTYPGADFASDIYDGTYFPDTDYTIVGAKDSAIVGYHKINGYQVILKDGKHFDSAQYLRAYTQDANGKALYTIRQGAQSIGASGASGFKVCRDRMLFTAVDGVYEILTTEVEAQTNLRCLSAAVRTHLERENVGDAVCVVHKNCYCAAMGNVMYVLDLARGGNWYIYRDLPQVLCLYSDGETLRLGCADGLYRFMAETEENAYFDNVGVGGDLSQAVGICAYWQMPASTLGCGFARKTVEDFCVYLQPSNPSSVRVRYFTDHEAAAVRHEEGLGRFDFAKLNFADFSFQASDFPVCINTRAKAKRVRVFGARVENCVPGEGLCVTGVMVKYRDNRAIR